MMITTKPGSKHARQMGRATAAATCMMFFVLCACGRKEAPPAAGPHRPRMEPKRAVERIENKEIEPLTVPEPGGLRPVRVTVLEYGSPAGEADVWIEHFSPTSSWWHARTRGDGRATLLVPIAYTWFRVSASKAPNAIAAQFMRNLPPRAEPLDITLNMTNQGVVITALLEAARPAMLSNVTVRIRPSDEPDWEDVSIARVPHTSGPRVVLPPVRRGLRGLRVEVMGPHLATSYSDYFDTLDGRDKTINVQLLEGVRVYGTARLADGSPAGSFTLVGTPVGLHGLEAGAGVVRAALETDDEGSYECASFAPDFYSVEAACTGARTMYTNMLVDELGTRLDIVFLPQPVMTIRGRVLEEGTRQPVAGAEVTIEHTGIMLTTDPHGAFTAQLLFDHQPFTKVRIRHPRYAEERRLVACAAQEKELEFLLYKIAIVYGTIRYEEGDVAAGVYVGLNEYTSFGDESSQAHAVFGGKGNQGQDGPAHAYFASPPSDAAGMYVISNVAAPKTYFFSVWGASSQVVHPKPCSPGVTVTPGAAVRCDLIVKHTPQVCLRVCGAQGMVVQQYQLQVASVRNKEGTERGCSSTIVTPNADGWVEISSLLNSKVRTVGYDFRAVLPDGTVAETNDLHFPDGGPYYVTLTVATNTSRGLCGYVYDWHRDPVAGAELRVEYDNLTFDRLHTDPLGFFELPGGSARPGATVRLETAYQGWWYGTSVVAGVQPVIWVLEEGRSIAGRVCIGCAGVPATNFAVSVDFNQPTAFRTPDGRFTLPLYPCVGVSGIVYVWVAEYAPAMEPFTLLPKGVTEIGDIIVAPWACAVRGRTVTERGIPLPAVVALRSTLPGFHMWNITTGVRDGAYEFARLPAGTYQVAAWKAGAPDRVESEWFSLSDGQTMTLPDLVINMSNAVLVRVVFVHAHGAPAARLRVSCAEHHTDANGAIEEFISIGKHAGWTLNDDINYYCAEAFEVTPSTHELRVMVWPRETIEGVATLDGVPMPWSAVKLYNTERRYACDDVINHGRFSWQAPPGRYRIVCVEERLVTTAHLAAGEGNQIAFTRGTGVLEVKPPGHGSWLCETRLLVEHAAHLLEQRTTSSEAPLVVERLPEGTYEVELRGYVFGEETNMIRRITLSRGERATLAF